MNYVFQNVCQNITGIDWSLIINNLIYIYIILKVIIEQL